MNDLSQNQTLFVIFCIQSLADKLDMPGNEIYNILSEKTDILDDYLIPCYDVLHTQGKEYITNDLLELIRDRGVVV